AELLHRAAGSQTDRANHCRRLFGEHHPTFTVRLRNPLNLHGKIEFLGLCGAKTATGRKNPFYISGLL
ncbi:MAG: hypothetical protein JOZ58_08365, partial [Acetobacteraceae bacterium]|nr:hypothetical protein [Acetobacteraceae bacterium]